MIVSIDPGDHIGFIMCSNLGQIIEGRTIEGEYRLKELWDMLDFAKPDIIIYEEFALRQSAAKKLVGNKFITCEVIGVIKLYSQMNNVPLLPLIPAAKEYCGFSSAPSDPRYKEIKMWLSDEKITEHVRDAFRLLMYARLFCDNVRRLL